jgi:hypothetical protein
MPQAPKAFEYPPAMPAEQNIWTQGLTPATSELVTAASWNDVLEANAECTRTRTGKTIRLAPATTFTVTAAANVSVKGVRIEGSPSSVLFVPGGMTAFRVQGGSVINFGATFFSIGGMEVRSDLDGEPATLVQTTSLVALFGVIRDIQARQTRMTLLNGRCSNWVVENVIGPETLTPSHTPTPPGTPSPSLTATITGSRNKFVSNHGLAIEVTGPEEVFGFPGYRNLFIGNHPAPTISGFGVDASKRQNVVINFDAAGAAATRVI